MTRIGLLSDTHSYFDPRLYDWFGKVDEIWHAGDVGSEELLDQMSEFKTLRAVYGNIDDAGVRARIRETERFQCEETDVMMTHIGGYPGNYMKQVRMILESNPPTLFISGHSHILKVIYDKKLNLLHLNPGAAGKAGFHLVRTALRFCIDGKEIRDMEIIEMGKRG